MCAKFWTNPTTLRVKALARKKVVKRKSPNFKRCSNFFVPSDRLSSQRELKKLKLCMYQINYFHNECLKNHPRPKFLRVKGLAKQKVVKPKSTKFTRCSTYSISITKKSGLKGIVGSWDSAYILVKYLNYVSAKFQSNRTTFRVKGLATKEVFKRKSKVTRWSTYSASDDQTSSQGELKKMKLCM